MKFFDRFKKSSPEASSQDSTQFSLEELLERAISDPAYRIKFYHSLLSGNVVALTDGSMHFPPGEYVFDQDVQINFVTLPTGEIPIFTSEERIFDHEVVKKEVHFIELKGRAVFEALPGKTFVLNPFSDYGQQILPEDVEMLLNGRYGSKSLTIKSNEFSFINEASSIDDRLRDGLLDVFRHNPSVESVYISYASTSTDKPHHIIGIKASGDIQPIFEACGEVVKKFVRPGQYIDFADLSDKRAQKWFSKRSNVFFSR